jgi:hypothetical protein
MLRTRELYVSNHSKGSMNTFLENILTLYLKHKFKLLIYWVISIIIISIMVSPVYSIICFFQGLVFIAFVWIGCSQVDVLIQKSDFKYTNLFPFTIGLPLIKFLISFIGFSGLLLLPILYMLFSFKLITISGDIKF